jgi:hypothetical protein
MPDYNRSGLLLASRERLSDNLEGRGSDLTFLHRASRVVTSELLLVSWLVTHALGVLPMQRIRRDAYGR